MTNQHLQAYLDEGHGVAQLIFELCLWAESMTKDPLDAMRAMEMGFSVGADEYAEHVLRRNK